MKRFAILAYGLGCFVIGFIGNIWASRAIVSPHEVDVAAAALVNLGLLGLFAVQHSVMAHPAFKRWWTRNVPQPAERSTYVLFSGLAWLALFWLWQPMGAWPP